jgi:hypothetical protein
VAYDNNGNGILYSEDCKVYIPLISNPVSSGGIERRGLKKSWRVKTSYKLKLGRGKREF